MIHASCSSAGPRGGRLAAASPATVDARARPRDGPHPGLAEDQLGPLVRVLGVHGHVGGAGGEYGEDRDVQLIGAGRHADADPVAEADPGGAQPPPQVLDLDGQRPVGQRGGPVVQGELVGVRPYGGLEDVDEGAGRGRRARRRNGPCRRTPRGSLRRAEREHRSRVWLPSGPRVSFPETSGALAGPQVCLGLSGSSSVTNRKS